MTPSGPPPGRGLLGRLWSRREEILVGRSLDRSITPSEVPGVSTRPIDRPDEAAALTLFEGARDTGPDLAERVSRGCVLFVAVEAPHPDRVAAYTLFERGVFSALERRFDLDAGVVFTHYTAVAPTFRRRGLSQLLRDARDAWLVSQGVDALVGVVNPGNVAAIRAFLPTMQDLGRFRRHDFLGGRITVWTPARSVRGAVRRLRAAAARGSDPT